MAHKEKFFIGTDDEYEVTLSKKGGHIVDPGKFEGERRYAPYYWNVMLNGFASDEMQVDGYAVSIFDLDESDYQHFPELRGTKQIAFYGTDQGFWTQVDVPTEEDVDEYDEEGY